MGAGEMMWRDVLETEMPKTEAATLVLCFKKVYENMTHEPFKSDKKDFILATSLVKKFGVPAIKVKFETLVYMCHHKSQWFTKDGWPNFSIGTMSTHWNRIIGAPAAQDPKQRERDEFNRRMKERRVNNV